MRGLHLSATLLAMLGLISCGSDRPSGVDLSRPVQFDVTTDTTPPAQLSTLNLFSYDGAGGFEFNDRVMPYDLNTPLFTDFASKARAFYVPPGETVTYTDDGPLDFPVGTILIKNFMVRPDLRAPEDNVRLVETRLLIHYEDGWEAFPYVWDEEGRDATLTPAGVVFEHAFTDAAGAARTANYLAPQRNQCLSCHQTQPEGASEAITGLIGPTARNLNRDYDFGGDVGTVNQLTRYESAGVLGGLPALASVDKAYLFDPVEAAGVDTILPEDLDHAARSYLDINCAHCHSPEGVQGVSSQLFLNYDNEDEFRLGVCKRPGSAGAGTGGLTFDIVPGDPDNSILFFRVDTEEVGAMMPLLGRSVAHDRGVELIRAWIAAMPAVDCDAQ